MTFIFDDKETAKIKEVNAAKLALIKAKRSAKELKSSTTNKICFSNIIVKDKITKTAILSASLMYAAKHVSSCSLQQIAYFIENEINADVLHSEKTTTKRIANHIKKDFQEKTVMHVITIDDLDIVHFTDVFRNDAKREYASVVALIKRVNKSFVDKSVKQDDKEVAVIDAVVAKDQKTDLDKKTITRKKKVA